MGFNRGFIALLVLVLSNFLSWNNVQASLQEIYNEFIAMKNDLPDPHPLDKMIYHQADMIDAMITYVETHGKMNVGVFDPSEATAPLMSRKIEEKDFADSLDVHTDIVFIGFPASAIDVIRSKWFEPMTYNDPTMASLGSDEHVVIMPGHVNVRHHFHLVQVSFEVADKIREYVANLLLRPTNDGDDRLYINSWEMEEILDWLNDVIASTHTVHGRGTAPSGSLMNQFQNTKSLGASNTLFILNLDITQVTNGREVAYSYRNGFSHADLKAIASNQEISKIAKDIIEEVKYGKLYQELPTDKTPLFDSKNLIDKYQKRAKINSESTGNEQVHWRDAVGESRVWAHMLSEKQIELSKVSGIV